jgi:hypothetical protein
LADLQYPLVEEMVCLAVAAVFSVAVSIVVGVVVVTAMLG